MRYDTVPPRFLLVRRSILSRNSLIRRRKKKGHAVEVKASTLFEAIRPRDQAERRKRGEVFVFELKKEYLVKLKDLVEWLDRNSRSPRETTDRLKIREILGIRKMR